MPVFHSLAYTTPCYLFFTPSLVPHGPPLMNIRCTNSHRRASSTRQRTMRSTTCISPATTGSISPSGTASSAHIGQQLACAQTNHDTPILTTKFCQRDARSINACPQQLLAYACTYYDSRIECMYVWLPHTSMIALHRSSSFRNMPPAARSASVEPLQNS